MAKTGHYQLAVTDGAGNWSITIPAAEPSQANVNAFVSDGAGNSATAMFDYTAEGGGAGGADLTVIGTGPTVSGTVSAQFFNRGVYLPIGSGYTANADGAGNWSITIPAAEPSQANVNAFVSDGNPSGDTATALFDYVS